MNRTTQTRLYLPLFFLLTGVIFVGNILYVHFYVYGQATTTSSTVTISVEITASSTPGGGFAPVTPTSTTIISPFPGPATLVLRGFTSPNALLYFYQDGTLVGTDKADALGVFSRAMPAVSGISSYGIASKDMVGLLTSTSNISLNLLYNATTTVSNIFLSPTIDIATLEIQKGGPARFFGSVFPGSKVFLTLDNNEVGSVFAGADGLWSYTLLTKNLAGSHTVFVKAIITDKGFISAPSPTLKINIREGVCAGPDFNGDGGVDIADLSIMLFYWRKDNPENQCVDLNSDNTVDIADLSLLMYAWTGNSL